MRPFIIGFVALGVSLGGGVALAADVAAPANRVQPPALASYNWTGPHAGVNVGYGWGRANTTLTDPTAFPFPLLSANPRGVLVGGNLGYDWQSGAFVGGIVADIDYAGLKGSSTANYIAFGIPTSSSENVRLQWLGTARLRAGVAIDSWLLYGTGGLAYGSLNAETISAQGAVTIPAHASGSKLGWTVGAGIEAAINRNLSVGVEYRYIKLGNIVQTSTVFVPVTNTTSFTTNAVMASVNFRL